MIVEILDKFEDWKKVCSPVESDPIRFDVLRHQVQGEVFAHVHLAAVLVYPKTSDHLVVRGCEEKDR